MKSRDGAAGWSDDLRAAHAAFAGAEAALQAELRQLRAEHQALLASSAHDSEELQVLRERVQHADTLVARLRAELDAAQLERHRLAQALDAERVALRSGEGDLQARLVEQVAEADQLRASLAAAQAEGARLWQSLQVLETHSQQHQSESAETLSRVRTRADDLEWQLDQVRREREDQVAALNRLLTERDHARSTELAALAQSLAGPREGKLHADQLAEEVGQLKADLAKVRESSAQQHADLLERLATGGRHAQDLAQALQQRDRLVDSLSHRLVDSTAQTDRVRQELEQSRVESLRVTRAHEADRRALREAAERDQRQLAMTHAEQLASQQAQWRDRETQLLAAQHAEQALAARLQAEHAVQLSQALAAAAAQQAQVQGEHAVQQWAQQQRVAELEQALRMAELRRETELREALAGRDAMAQEAQAAQARFGALATSHATALQVLDESRESQRLQWVQQRHDQRLELIEALQSDLSTLRADRDTLALEVAGLQQALAQALKAAQEAQRLKAELSTAPPPAPATAYPAANPAATPAPAPPAAPAHAHADPHDPLDAAMHDKPYADDLLRLHDEAFVDAAYRALLGRAPEAEGKAAYLAQLRQGVAKERLLIAMAASDEARQAGRALPGLDGLAQQLDRRETRLLPRVVRRLWGDPEPVAEGPLAAVENRLGALGQQGIGLSRQLVDALGQLAQHVARIDQRVHALDQQLARVDARMGEAVAQGNAMLPRLHALEDGMNGLLRRAGDIEARLAGLAEVPQTLQEHQVGLLQMLARRAAPDPAGAAAPHDSGTPAFDPGAIVRVRKMLKAATEPAP